MPRPRQEPSLVEHLTSQVVVKPVNDLISLKSYYRSADLLLSQAHLYRSNSNYEQLYVMLMRFASLVIETIPKHRDHRAQDSQYMQLKTLLLKSYFPELEQLKRDLQLRDVQPVLRSTNRPSYAQQISASNLPDVDWSASVATPQLPRPSGDPFPQFPLTLPPPSSTSSDPFGPLIPSTTTSSYTSSPPPYTSSASLAYTSQATLNKHALFAPSTAISTTYSNYRNPRPTFGTTVPPPSYPRFDNTPAAPVDLLSFSEGQSTTSTSSQGTPEPPSTTELVPSMAYMNMGPNDSLLDAPMLNPPPSAGLSLGPQEVQVHNVNPGSLPPGQTCLHDPTPVAPAPDSSSIKEITKRAELRDVHISVALMEEFLQYAVANTRKGIESCGILAGRLSANDSVFTITSLIIPKQQGTTDTVQALNEEEILDVQLNQELYPLGWIHTHPTQTCFLSSIDVHTQCGYQTMLDEAVAIVMAPTDRKNKCGIFRLTTPGGLSLVQKCTLRGFHAHPPTDTGQDIYDFAGHVYLNPRTKHQVVDLR